MHLINNHLHIYVNIRTIKLTGDRDKRTVINMCFKKKVTKNKFVF